jgi:hypothetical protein
MKNLMDKLQEKELQIEALRAQIAKLEKDIETLQSAARILADEDDGNPLTDLVAPELSGKSAGSNGFDQGNNKKKAWP